MVFLHDLSAAMHATCVRRLYNHVQVRWFFCTTLMLQCTQHVWGVYINAAMHATCVRRLYNYVQLRWFFCTTLVLQCTQHVWGVCINAAMHATCVRRLYNHVQVRCFFCTTLMLQCTQHVWGVCSNAAMHATCVKRLYNHVQVEGHPLWRQKDVHRVCSLQHGIGKPEIELRASIACVRCSTIENSCRLKRTKALCACLLQIDREQP